MCWLLALVAADVRLLSEVRVGEAAPRQDCRWTARGRSLWVVFLPADQTAAAEIALSMAAVRCRKAGES